MSVETEIGPAPAPNGRVHLSQMDHVAEVAEPVAPVKKRRVNPRRLILPIGAVILVFALVFGVNMAAKARCTSAPKMRNSPARPCRSAQ